MNRLTVFAPAGVELRAPALKLAKKRLSALGFEVTLDTSVRARHQRFAGDDEARLATLYRVADTAPSVDSSLESRLFMAARRRAAAGRGATMRRR